MPFTVPKHFTSIESAISSLFGNSIKITHTDSIAGGDINNAYGLTLSCGTRIFMKSNKKENFSFFAAEAIGLAAIAQTKAIGAPRVLGCGTDEKSRSSFLLLEFVSGKSRVKNYWETFAHELADMHKAKTDDFAESGKYGFISDNYIGSRKQINMAHDSFISFFIECRLKPQFKDAKGYFDMADLKKIEKLLNKLDDILVEPKKTSLLHGDLWSGNFIAGDDGKAWIIDPAAYVGNAEADIAMTELFGGYPQTFYDAYRESGLLQPEYDSRRDLYNLYHLLNHLNMFGYSYLSAVRRIVGKYI